HDAGTKRILGQSGKLNGEDFVRIILQQRACADFVAMKLYTFFVGPIPDDPRDQRTKAAKRVVNSMASTLRKSNYDLKPALKQLFLSKHFYEPAIMTQQIKSPAELVVTTVRSLRTPVRDLAVLIEAMDLMGQNLFFPPNVAGWAGNRTWINTSTLFIRQNIMAYMLTGTLPRGFDPTTAMDAYDPTPMLEDLAAAEIDPLSDPERALPYLLRFMLGGEPRDRHLTVLNDFVSESGGKLDARTVTGCMAVITAMPEYQLT
ncbi:MAG: DUF1800 family protein, partial [Planctomycetota bacterium]